MSGIAAVGYNPYATSPYATQATGTATPAAPAHPGFFQRIKDGFANMGLGMGFGPEARAIKDAFRRLDHNHDKSLDANEFGVVGNAFAQGPAAFGSAAGSDQKVSLGEFKSWLRGNTRTEFERVDTNRDGAIDTNEFTAIQRTNPGLAITGMDTNNDQRISFREYLRFRVSQLVH